MQIFSRSSKSTCLSHTDSLWAVVEMTRVMNCSSMSPLQPNPCRRLQGDSILPSGPHQDWPLLAQLTMASGMCFRTQQSVPESGPPNRPGSQASWKFPSPCWREEVLPVLSLMVCAALRQQRRSSQSPPGRPLLTLPFPQNRQLHPLLFPSQAGRLAQVTTFTQGWDQSGHGCTAL